MAESDAHTALDLPVFETFAPRLLIVCAPYYRAIADHQITGAERVVARAGATSETVFVPGALEIPTAIHLAAGAFDGFVALGCVIRGETTHYDTVCNDSSRALSLLGLRGVCIGNGILTCETLEQAEVRANPDDMDKGGGAAAAALHLVSLAHRFGQRSATMDDETILLAGTKPGHGSA